MSQDIIAQPSGTQVFHFDSSILPNRSFRYFGDPIKIVVECDGSRWFHALQIVSLLGYFADVNVFIEKLLNSPSRHIKFYPLKRINDEILICEAAFWDAIFLSPNPAPERCMTKGLSIFQLLLDFNAEEKNKPVCLTLGKGKISGQPLA